MVKVVKELDKMYLLALLLNKYLPGGYSADPRNSGSPPMGVWRIVIRSQVPWGPRFLKIDNITNLAQIDRSDVSTVEMITTDRANTTVILETLGKVEKDVDGKLYFSSFSLVIVPSQFNKPSNY